MENLEIKINMREIIANPEELKRKIEKFKQDGFEKMHVLSDFDRTLTYGSVDGVKTPSIISMLRDGKHLSEEYAREAHALYDKYHGYEESQSLSTEERKIKMREWWDTHNRLLVESGLSFSDLEDIVEHGHVCFREGVEEFLDWSNASNVPVVIMSASGCGDAIKLFFKKIKKDYPNINYVINQFEWDAKGKAIKSKEPVIHSLNKDETVLSDLPKIYEQIRDRKNVILLGDGLHDLDMVKGFDYDEMISIGFQNSSDVEQTEKYSKNFDVVLEGDGDFEEVNKLLEELD